MGARADYAVRAMLAIAAAERARAAGEQRAATATELAAAQAIPHSLLRAILTELRSAGLLRSHHGTDGGFSLAYPASEITVGAVLRAVAGPLVTVSGLPADRVVYHGVAAGLTDVWRAVNAAIEAVVDRTSLADLLAASQPPAGPRRPR
ncbi:MAG TPA: Rrf2 family transcriptional regulator [Natronosporangium sp.]